MNLSRNEMRRGSQIKIGLRVESGAHQSEDSGYAKVSEGEGALGEVERRKESVNTKKFYICPTDTTAIIKFSQQFGPSILQTAKLEKGE